MGQQVIKQPDGLYAVFSTITDTISVWDATAEEVVNYFVQQASAEARRSAESVVAAVVENRPRDAYHQFVMTWEQALDSDREHGGDAWHLVGPPDHCPDAENRDDR